MILKNPRYQFLVQQYKNNIYTYAMYMLKNKMDADDVTQEVLIRIWKNLDRFNILAAKTWIMKTTYNLCIDYLRKRSVAVNREYYIDEDLAETVRTMKSEDNPFLITHLNMMASTVKKAIMELPENLRSVFILYEIEGMKYKEISKALDLPLNSVKVYLLRARKKLQEELKNYEAHEVI